MSREAFGDPPESQEPPQVCPLCGGDSHAEGCEFGKEVALRLKAERDAHKLAHALENVAMMLRKCAHRLRCNGHEDLSADAVGLLRRLDLLGSPLRSEDGAAQADAQPVAPLLLKGIGKINGDGWKDTTRIGDVVYAWNCEMPEPYAPGQFPRLGNPIWSASTQQYDFRAVPNAELSSVVDQVIEELRAEVRELKDALAAAPPAPQPAADAQPVAPSDAPICPWCDRQGWDTCGSYYDTYTCEKR